MYVLKDMYVRNFLINCFCGYRSFHLKHPGMLPSQGCYSKLRHVQCRNFKREPSTWSPIFLSFMVFPAYLSSLECYPKGHSFCQLRFFHKPNSQRWQKSTHLSCPSLHLLLRVQWQIPVLLCANVTALFTADLRVYIRPLCYLPVSLILSAANPSYVVGVAASVLKEFVSVSAGTNPPCAKPLCRICSNSNFDKDVLSTSTRRDCFFFRCTWR